MSTDSLQALLQPRSLAVIGASSAPEKYGYIILKNIIDAGFKGTIYPINPKAEEILGLKCYPNVGSLDVAVDLAVIIIPARLVPQTIEECGKKGIRGAIIISGGFAETGPEGEELQKQLVAAAKKYEVRVVGPNCQGVNNPHYNLCASWPLLTQKGRMAVISQSGTVGAALMDWASQEELGVSAFISMGNRADVDEADLIGFFGRDENTRAIAVYIEGVKDAPKFLAAIKKCPKPVVILKAGRTPKGRVAAESHTKSLAGRDEIYQAVFKQNKIHLADTVEELYDFAKAFAYLNKPKGKSVLIVTTSGGAGILATDQAEYENLDLKKLPLPIKEKLQKSLPPHCIVANPLDLTGDANADTFGMVYEAAAKDFDTVLLLFGDPILGASQKATPGANQLVVFLGGAEVERKEKILMHRKGIPVFPTPERGMKALAELLRY